MAATYYTIGMAGHIDHGKTALTKALTNVDTDRLKEEKERGISIEPGYAPMHAENDVQVSIVDVPGHEKFIRQMISGVAGIDLVVLVVAADEGVMPQTEEHLEILQLLGVERCIIAITKIGRVDEIMLELVTEDIRDRLTGTIFEKAPHVLVDSIEKKGIDELKEMIFAELAQVQHRDAYGSFRLPIDQVFTVQGQGTVVRGTVYEGAVQQGSQLTILPKGLNVKARQIQVHHQEQEFARAGQRTAINLGGVEKSRIVRGDVLVASDHFLATDTIDIALKLAGDPSTPLKQRMPVKVHIGTSEVMGKIVFFDRNEWARSDGEVLCQIRLDEQIVARRGDRFIVRRPTPVETLGGGWVIQPNGGKYRFGDETMHMLQRIREGTPEDLVVDVLQKHIMLDLKSLIQQTSLEEPVLKNAIGHALEAGTLIAMPGGQYSLSKIFRDFGGQLAERLMEFHEAHPMRTGMGKAELVQSFGVTYPAAFIDYALNRLVEEESLKKTGQFLALSSFEPHLPKQWKTRMEQMLAALEKDGLKAEKWETYSQGSPVPKQEMLDFTFHLLETGQAYRLTEEILVHHTAFERSLNALKQQTQDAFDLKQAKDALEVSRKYLIPFLELLDQRGLTVRMDEQRKWTENNEKSIGKE